MKPGPQLSGEDLYNELYARIVELEQQVAELKSADPANIDIRLRDMNGRLAAIETDEDPLPPVIGGDEDSREWEICIGGKYITLTGTPQRYIWVDYTNETAYYSATTASPMPDGIEVYDTTKRHIHIPRV